MEVTMEKKKWKWGIVFGLVAVLLCSGTYLVKVQISQKEDRQAEESIEAARIPETADDKTLSETEKIREIDINILSDFNISFEGADENGLYWWADADWQKANVQQKPYDEMPTGLSVDGEYYMFANTVDSISTAQICAESLASSIVPGQTYEFSYWVKLTDGASDEKVELQVASVNADWSSMSYADFTLDSELGLDDNWQQVSGTFTIPANAANVQTLIRFTGEGEHGFCIDDLRVGKIESEDTVTGDNLVKNPNFAEDDLNVWEGSLGEAVITQGIADEVIFGDVRTYGVISGRTTSQDCFEQEMTASIKSGGVYEYSFYVMLDGEDYADAPAEQREVCFAPYIVTEDSATYWGSYSEGILDGNCIKQIEAGEWVKFSGVFKPKFEGNAQKLAIRLLEQGTDYGSGDCVKGKYYITGVTICERQEAKKEIEKDIPNLKDVISSEEGLGTDCYVGTALMQSELSDETLMELVNKHFNALTLVNELKMDALFDYHDNNNSAPGFETISWTRADGTKIDNYKVPILKFSRAESMLDKIKEWNDGHPDNMIKVRGHVLVWHSQAPEWFFREDWDINKNYVSDDEMDVRQEWYIKTVLEHFVGENSGYKDLFYGWDVVNEAVSDSTGTYRNDSEDSSWWSVYGSEDYIISAFRYANWYAPKELELYYNDYNECGSVKVEGITKLLQEVKSHEKDGILPTRITGMGMQSHHNMSSPTVNQIREAAIAYGKIVGKIQLTELDIKASDEFDGTDTTLGAEYTRQAYRYKEIYDVFKEIDAMEGIDVNNITLWGVIDGNSWLQSNNSVGGASDGSKRQVPLLFDDDYKAKPAFYAFADPKKLEPYIQNITVVQAAEGEDRYANGIQYDINGIDASFIPIWDENGLYFKISVFDTSVDASDQVSVYVDWEKSMCDGANMTCVSQSRTDAIIDEDGRYTVEIEIKSELSIAQGFAIDVLVTDADNKYAFNDSKLMQDSSSKYFATAVVKPYIKIANAADAVVVIDGSVDAAWESVDEIPLTITSGSPKATASVKALWDKDYLYVLAIVTDPELDKHSEQAHEQDSVEVFIDENNHKSDTYEKDDKQYRINFDNEQTFNGADCTADNLKSATKITENGYVVEAAYRWTEIIPEAGNEIGLELQINDCEQGVRIGTVSWYDESGQGWSSPKVFGSALLNP